MTKELREKLAALRAAAPQLNTATAEANELVQAVEALLGVELSLGISAQVGPFATREIGDGRSDDDMTDNEVYVKVWACSYLAYGRVSGSYRLHVVDTVEKTVGYGADAMETILSRTETPWPSCPREVKLQAFAELPTLLGQIADAALSLTDGSAKTACTVRDLIDAMGGISSKSRPEPAAGLIPSEPIRIERERGRDGVPRTPRRR